MVSIVVCSIKPELLDIFKENVASTIGDCEYEVLAIDNRERKWPIAKAYNEGARSARYPYLLFAHEDIEFLNPDWGKTISLKLAEDDCGVIGFAGATYRAAAISGWAPSDKDFCRTNFHLIDRKGNMVHDRVNMNSGFEQVLTIDGMAMFVRKDVWEKFPFDEEHLKGFHCYDIDFSMQIAKKYRNYVCGTVDVLHKSNGSYDASWIDATFRIMRTKWNKMQIDNLEHPDAQTTAKIHEDLLWVALKMAWKHKSMHYESIVKEYRKLPWSYKHLNRSLRLFFKYGSLPA